MEGLECGLSADYKSALVEKLARKRSIERLRVGAGKVRNVSCYKKIVIAARFLARHPQEEDTREKLWQYFDSHGIRGNKNIREMAYLYVRGYWPRKNLPITMQAAKSCWG